VKRKLDDGREAFTLGTALVLLGAVIVAAAVGLLAAYAFSGGPGQKRAPSASEEDLQAERSSADAIVPFGPVTVNLSEGRLTRMMRINIKLRTGKESAQPLKELLAGERKAVYTDWLVRHLSDKGLKDVTGTESINRLGREIQDGFNALLAEDGGYKVDAILFEEFIVQ